jgi:radical SAM superfamily enzyme YgiQ (UPF0313 family)
MGCEAMNKRRIVFLQRELEDNLGVLWIASYLSMHGFDARVLLEEKATYSEIAELKPSVVGYSCMTGQQDWVIESIAKVQALGQGSLCIVGGPHATFYPKMLENGTADAIVRGEGELAMLDFMSRVEGGGDLLSVPNTVWRKDGETIANPLHPLLPDLNILPIPDRSYYGRYRFLAQNSNRTFITGRGCPFQCTFCFNHALHAMYGKTARYIRRHSTEYAIRELVDVKRRWGLTEVRFSDDHFSLDSAWLAEFIPQYRREIGRPFSINARVDSLDEEKIALLAEGGCRLVCFGIETGREDLRNTVLKKRITDGDIVNTAQLLHKYKIRFLSSNIIGLPGETAGDAWETVRINQRIGTDLPWFSLMQYYPGTEIYRQASEAGMIAPDFDPGRIKSYFRNSYLKQGNMGELQNIHSLSILCCWLPFLTPMASWLAGKAPPNAAFRLVFTFCYGLLTIRRSHLGLCRIVKGLGYYWRRLWS